MHHLLLLLLCFSAQAASKLEKTARNISGLNAEFQAPLLEWLEAISAKTEAEQLSEVSAPCEAIERLPVDRCAAGASQARVWEQGRAVCRRAYDPFGDFLRSSPRMPAMDETQDLETMIDLIGVPLAHMGLPGAFRTRSLRSEAAAIIGKVRHESQRRQLSALRDAWEAFRLLGERDSSCRPLTSDPGFPRAAGELRLLERHLTELERRVRPLASAPGLPYPLLSDRDRLLVSAVVGAFAWRVRGKAVYIEESWVPQHRRLKWVRNPFNMLARLSGGAAADGTGTKLMLPLLTGGYSRYFDMGHLPGHKGDTGTLQEDFRSMVEVGERFVGTAASYLRGRGFNPAELEFAGRQIAACYLYAWDVLVPAKVEWGRDSMPPPLEQGKMAGGPLTWGELCYGAGLGLGLSRSLLGK